MDNVKIDVEKIVGAISEQFQTIYNELSSDPALADYKEQIKQIQTITVLDEQSFTYRKEQLDTKALNIVVHFGSASVNFGSSIVPISLVIMGTSNKVKPTQTLLNFFASRWNLKTLCEGSTSQYADTQTSQLWTTPNVVTNFLEVDNTFRNLFSMAGTLIVGKETIKLGSLIYYYHDTEEGVEVLKHESIDFLAFDEQFNNALNPIPTGRTFGFSKSENKFSTYTFSVSTYLLNSKLVRDCMAAKGFRQIVGEGSSIHREGSTIDPNHDFILYLEFSNGFTNTPLTNEQHSTTDPVLGEEIFFNRFKLVNMHVTQEVGRIPSLTLTFTR